MEDVGVSKVIVHEEEGNKTNEQISAGLLEQSCREQ